MELEEKISKISSYAKSDLDWTRIYLDKNVTRIKNKERQYQVSKQVQGYYNKLILINKDIIEEHDLIKANLEKAQETVQNLKSLEYDQEKLNSEDNCIECVHKLLHSKLVILEKYKPKKIDSKINIEEEKFELENPILVNRNDWIRLELDVAVMDENFNPEKLFEILRKDASRKTVQVSIGVIGRACVGKSSFLNAFFGFMPNDDKYIKADFVENAEAARPYYVDEEKYKNFLIWDTPGVGTINFKFENYHEIINRINCDAYIYLYDIQFNEVDKRVIQMVRKKTNRIFICRTKVDNDFKRLIEKKEKAHFSRISQEKRKMYLTPWSAEYQSVFKELKDGYEKNRTEKEDYLKDEKVIFYMSNKDVFRNLFEFELFIKSLYESLPKVQGDIILDEIRTKSIYLLGKKKDVIFQEIDNMASNWIGLFQNQNEYKKWVSATLQEYARRLGLNEIFKELDQDQDKFNKLLNQIEKDLPVQLDLIRSKADTVLISGEDVNIDNLSLTFWMRNFGTKNKLIKKTSDFLKKNLDILFEHAKELFQGYYIAKLETN